jgi:hypothetical protein
MAIHEDSPRKCMEAVLLGGTIYRSHGESRNLVDEAESRPELSGNETTSSFLIEARTTLDIFFGEL